MRSSVLALVAVACGPAEPLPELPPSVLLVTLDTTRADALGAYGGPPGLTPHLDAMAQRGIVFEEVMATAPLTAPAHASLLTGRYPHHHGLRNNNHYRMRPDIPTLPQAFRDAGFATAGFVSAAVLDRSMGLDRGFDTYVDDVPDQGATPMSVPELDGAALVDLTATWFDRQVTTAADQPVFLWVHLYDAHAPYAPAPAFVARHADPYLAEVAELDSHVASLQRALEGRDPDRRWVVSLIADHGEGRGDHGEAAHGLFLYRSTLRVPWILVGPDVPTQTRVATAASQVDLAATLAGLAGVPWDPADGVDLQSAWSPQPTHAPRTLYAETLVPLETYGLAPLFAYQRDPFRVIDAPRAETFQWRDDPAEAHDLGSDTEAVQAARAWRQAHEGAGQLAPHGDAPTDSLVALGYLDSLPGGLPTSILVDPKDVPDLPERVATVIREAHVVPPREGAARMQAVLDDHPGVLQLHTELASAWAAAGEPQRGLDVLDRLPLPADSPYGLVLRASLLDSLGRPDDAMALLRTARQRAPAHQDIGLALAEMLHRHADHAAAREVLDSMELSDDSLASQLLHGRVLLALGLAREAIEPLSRALALDSDHIEVVRLLAPALAQAGWSVEAEALAHHAIATQHHPGWAHALLGRLRYAQGGCARAQSQVDLLRSQQPPPPEAEGLLRDCP